MTPGEAALWSQADAVWAFVWLCIITTVIMGIPAAYFLWRAMLEDVFGD